MFNIGLVLVWDLFEIWKVKLRIDGGMLVVVCVVFYLNIRWIGGFFWYCICFLNGCVSFFVELDIIVFD